MKNKGGIYMKLNNKGFIAISLIYSFFLVFLITLLAIVSDYAQNRILLNDVKKETQEYLNGLASFNPIHLENKPYSNGDVVPFGNEEWIVLQDLGEYVTLLLNRNLTTSDGIGIVPQALNPSGEGVSMCLNSLTPSYCYFVDEHSYNPYRWNTSVVKKIVKEWYNANASLKKAEVFNILQDMGFSDTTSTINMDKIRIPEAQEYSSIPEDIQNTIWYLTSDGKENETLFETAIIKIKIGEVSVDVHTTYKNIRPVIMVKKST